MSFCQPVCRRRYEWPALSIDQHSQDLNVGINSVKLPFLKVADAACAYLGSPGTDLLADGSGVVGEGYRDGRDLRRR